jgi:Domain of unknown function (DUF3291)
MTTDATGGVSATGPYPGFHLAQVNIGRPTGPLDSPELADFTQNLDKINALGKQAPGFVWLLEGDCGAGATDVRWPGDPEMLVNMSVWESVDALREFAFKSRHVEIMRRRREFFVPLTEAIAALWWVPAGTTPTVAEAHERVVRLREHGATAYAFTFQRPFAPEGF